MATFVSFVIFSGEFLPIFAAIFFLLVCTFLFLKASSLSIHGYVEQREPLVKLYQAYLMHTLH